jgi:hypothetical protein
MLRRVSPAALVASLILFIAAGPAYAMSLWSRGRTPPFSVPYDLGPDTLKIELKIREYRQYDIDLIIRYRVDTQRDLARRLAGGPDSHPNADRGVPTEFLITVKRLPGGQEVANIRFESFGIRRNAGLSGDGMAVFARGIGAVRLRPGRYVMEVVNLRDAVAFEKVRTEVGLFYNPKNTPIRD